MTGNTGGKVQQFAKNNFEAALHTLKDEYQAKRKTVGASLAARRLGLGVSPSHSIYDNVELWHCEAVLRAKANALFKAYEVYHLTPDDSILEELRSYQQQHSANRKSSLMNETILRGQRMRINPAADLAHIQELAQKIESSTRALLKVFACELEERRYMPKAEKTRTVTYSQNVYGNPRNVAQGESATIGVYAVGDCPEGITGFVVTDPKMHQVSMQPDHIATAVIAPARKHGLIHKTPQNLRQIIEVMQDVDIDLLSILRQRLRQWREDDANTIGARILLLLIFPKYREESSPPETWELDISGFLLLDPVREAGAKLGLWQVMPGGTLAMLIGGGDDHSTDIAVQIVNPVKQLTKTRAALFNGTQANDQKMVMIGMGALGSMTFQNLVRKGFGTWSIVDDDLMMPHNAARHVLTALPVGF